MSAVSRQVVTYIQEPARLNLQAGFLPHFPDQCFGQGFAVFNLAAGQAPRPPGAGVLVQHQDAVIFDDDASHMHGLVSSRSRYLPKEFYPVDDRPGIAHLLDEIAALGPAEVVIIYHPYYEAFAAWARAALSPQGQDRYHQAARPVRDPGFRA